MKNQLLLLIFSFGMLTGSLQGQDFIGLFKSGVYEELKSHLKDQVKLEIDRDKKVVSRNEAIKAVKNKMEEFKAIEWEAMHNGSSSTSGSKYLIAKVYNERKEGLRFFLHLENINGVQKISAIRIRKLL